ncbi:MAG: creatininase family protein [Chloroflexota bacterium]
MLKHTCEQHGYLSLLTDIKIPLALADAASTRTGILVAPPLNFGSSPYFLAYPGTFSLRLATFMDALEDILRSAYGQGFERILILNGHGGNSGARARLHEIANELPGLRMEWYSWWQAHSVEAVTLRHGIKPGHGNWLEAFPFTVVSELPDGDKIPPNVPGSVLTALQAREVYGDGSFGGRYRVEQSVLDEIFAAALDDILHLLKFA